MRPNLGDIMPQTQTIAPDIAKNSFVTPSLPQKTTLVSKQSCLADLCTRIKRIIAAIWDAICSLFCAKKSAPAPAVTSVAPPLVISQQVIAPVQKLDLDISLIIKSTPKFNKYGFAADPNVHLTDLTIRPCNLFYEALFRNRFTVTQPGDDAFLRFNQPLSEVREYILSLPDETVISFSAMGRKAGLYLAKLYFGEVDLTTYFGWNTYQISAKEIKEMINSQRIHVSALIPRDFYLGMKDALANLPPGSIPGDDSSPITVSQLADQCAPLKTYFKEVQANPSKYGFINDGTMFSFDQILRLTAYQLGSMIVKTDNYHCLVNQDYAIADRKIGQHDAIMQICACGIRGFFASTTLPGNEQHQIDYRIMQHTFQTLLKSAGKDAFILMPALGMGVWGGNPNIYWRAFLDAVLLAGSDLQNILVNPNHKPTPDIGWKGEEFAKILDEYKRAHPTNGNLNKIINLFDEKTDLLALAQNLKKAHPNRTVAIVNASDPDVTLGIAGPGEYANDICHAPTTEENFAVAGATLGFEGVTGVPNDINRVLKGF